MGKAGKSSDPIPGRVTQARKAAPRAPHHGAPRGKSIPGPRPPTCAQNGCRWPPPSGRSHPLSRVPGEDHGPVPSRRWSAACGLAALRHRASRGGPSAPRMAWRRLGSLIWRQRFGTIRTTESRGERSAPSGGLNHAARGAPRRPTHPGQARRRQARRLTPLGTIRIMAWVRPSGCGREEGNPGG